MADLITLARPYAKAAFQVAVADDALQYWSGTLSLLVSVARHETVAKALSSPSLTEQQQVDLLLEVTGDQVTGRIANFVKVLAENKRLDLLPQIHQLFEEMKSLQEKTLDVEVTSAYPLADGTQEKLANALSKRLQRSVKIQSQIDKSLIGGIVLRAGDLVIDGSVRGKLMKLAEAMNS
jgi:F-type H+-transporting ATPase subunit delta